MMLYVAKIMLFGLEKILEEHVWHLTVLVVWLAEGKKALIGYLRK